MEEGVGGGGGGEFAVLWMLSDRDRLEEGALILLVCASGGCTHICTCMLVTEKKEKKLLRAVSKQAIGQNCSLALKWCSTILF